MLQSYEKFHSAHGKRLVLVADDEMVNREILGMVLDADYEVIFAENGREALQKMRTHHELLSIVLLDLMMPGVDGFEVIRQVRSKEENDDMKIVVLSALNSTEDIVRAYQAGANDFITKPIVMEKLINSVATQLRLIK